MIVFLTMVSDIHRHSVAALPFDPRILHKVRKFQNFRVNLWDFGGQEIYHATHQFFLTKRSLYTIVADSRKEDTDFNYWLNIVELLGGDSPVLIIKNEKQDRERQIGEPQLRRRFKHIKETSACGRDALHEPRTSYEVGRRN